MKFKDLFAAAILVSTVAATSAYAYYSYAWGYGTNGSENCYPSDGSGRPLTGSSPVPNYYCR